MTVGLMHSIKNKKNILARAQRDWNTYKKVSTGKKIYFGKIETVSCSQCKRGMKKSLADKQIQFKRENAPICIPCIQGIPRRDIELNIKASKRMEEIKQEWRQGKSKRIKRQNLKEIEELFNR